MLQIIATSARPPPTIDNDLLVKLKEKAEYDDRSLSQYINIVLKQHIKLLEDKQ